MDLKDKKPEDLERMVQNDRCCVYCEKNTSDWVSSLGTRYCECTVCYWVYRDTYIQDVPPRVREEVIKKREELDNKYEYFYRNPCKEHINLTNELARFINPNHKDIGKDGSK